MAYGPVDFIALEFQNNKLKGEILPALIELIENKIVRVIDLVIIQKYEDGHHEAVEVNQLASDLLGVFDPLNAEISGLIQVEDIDRLAGVMANGTTAAALLFENLWSIRFREAVKQAQGRLIEHVRLYDEDVEQALAIFASKEAK